MASLLALLPLNELQQDLGVSRLTATKYLEALVADGFLAKRKVGRSNYYVNSPLYEILIGTEREADWP